jgi:hypothetical protein
MADNTLDRLSRENNEDVRRYLANLIGAAGANREQVVKKLRDRYGVTVTTRTVTNWQNNDPALVAMLRELEDIRHDLNPGEGLDALLPEAIDPADASGDLFDLAVKFPAFGKLIYREGKRDEDDPAEDDVLVVLAAEHDTAEDFAADCARRLGDYNPHVPTPGAGSLS